MMCVLHVSTVYRQCKRGALYLLLKEDQHQAFVDPGVLVSPPAPLPQASVTFVHPSLLSLKALPLTIPTQYMFKGPSLQTFSKLHHPLCILGDLAFRGSAQCLSGLSMWMWTAAVCSFLFILQ